MRRLIASLLCVALSFFATVGPASADRVITYPGQLGSSTEQNQGPRFMRLAFGTWIRDALGPTTSAGGVYSNLTVVPNGGMYVATQPTLPNSMAALYQIAVDDANPIPANGTPSLPADATKIVVQALQGGVSSSLGPISAPGSGLSQYYLVEAQVQTTDTTPTSMTFTSSNGSYTNVVDVTRADQIVYQLKAGTAASSPLVPTVDTGWIGIATILVPSGTASITTGMIAPLPSFTGFLTNGQAATISALTLQGFGNGCLQVTGGGVVQSLPCTSGLGVVNGTAGQINVSTVAGAATVSLAHGDYADLVNTQTIGGAKTFSSSLVEDQNVQIPAAGTATSTANYGSAGAYYLYNSLWNGSSAVSHAWELIGDSSGNLLVQYDGSTLGTVSHAGTATFANAILTGLSASSCVATDASEQLVSSSGCLTALTAGPCLVSSGGSSPTLGLQMPLPTTCGGTDATSYTSGEPLYYNGTSFASATVNAPLAFASGALSCATCVTAVTGSGNIASSGGTTPNLTFTGTLPIANGGGNASSYTPGDLLYYDGTKFNSAAVSGPLGFASGTLSCSTCAVTNANNNFSTDQTIHGILISTGTGTGAANEAIGGGLQFNTTGTSNAGTGVNALLYNTTGNLNSAVGTSALSSNTSGTSNAAVGANALYGCTSCSDNTALGGSPDAASFNQITTGNQNISIGYDVAVPSPTANGQLDIGNAIYGLNNTGTTTTVSTGCIMLYSITCPSGLSFYVNGPMEVTSLYDSGVAANSLACLGTGSLFVACTVSSPLSFSGTTLSLGLVPISLGGTNATSATTGCIGYNGTAYAHSNCGDTAGTGLGFSGTTFSLTVPVTTADGGTDQTSWTSGDCVRASSATQLASAAGDCVTSVTGGNGITSTGGTTPAISVTGCSAATCRVKLEIPLCYQSGTVSTSAACPTQPIVNFSGAQITGLRAFCTTKDNGTTVFTAYTVNYSTGAQTSAGTLTLSSTNYESDDTITTVNLSAPEGLYGNVTTAGTASGCTFVAEGTQQVL
jgi:hypothetical protein